MKLSSHAAPRRGALSRRFISCSTAAGSLQAGVVQLQMGKSIMAIDIHLYDNGAVPSIRFSLSLSLLVSP